MNFTINDFGLLMSFDMIATLAMGLVSLFIGMKIKKEVEWFSKFGIPAPVIGGLIFAIIHLILRETGVGTIAYTTTLQTPFMVVFFTTIGLGSSIAELKKGGKLLLIFWILSGIMTFMQTVIGVSVAKLTNINPLFGVLGGSVSMSGGHGAAGAFGQTVEAMGVTGASTMALSSATFGLIAGGLLGAPLAFSLIRKHNLKPKFIKSKDEVIVKSEIVERKITADSLLQHIGMIAIVMTVGMFGSYLLKSHYNIALPSYVGAMFSAIIFNNLNNRFKWIDIDRNMIDLLGHTSLNIFLSMALISLKLWELASLALPMIIMLSAQVVFMFFYTKYIVFKLLGKDYDSAVMVSGMCGSGLGATTNAMLNMGEVSEKFGYTVNPYLVVPLTGAFLIDMFQMPVIIAAINLFK